MPRVCVSRKALRQKVHVRLAHTTVTPVNENGDEKGGRLESFSPRNPFSSPFSSTDSHVSHRANENTTCIDRAAVLRNQLTMNALLG